MRIIEVSTVVGCQLSCPYCPQKIHVQNYAQNSSEFKMSLETFKACLETAPLDVEMQFVGMAEPWLNENCTDMLLYTHKRGHSVAVFTTCVGMTLEDVERIQHVPMRIFCIHLPDDAGQMHMTVDQNYIEVVKACMAKIPTTTLMCVGRLHRAVEAGIGKMVGDGTKSLISRAGNLQQRAIPRKSGKLKRLPCMDHNVLLPNGDVVLCCMDYSLKEKLGSLLETPYEKLFEGEGFQRILRGLEDDSIDIICRNCEIAEKA